MTGVAFSRSAARAVPGRRAHHHRRVDVRTKVGSWPFALPAKEQPATSFAKGITYISYEGNSFYVKFNATGARVLVDPWLVGDLVFGDQDWLYKGECAEKLSGRRGEALGRRRWECQSCACAAAWRLLCVTLRSTTTARTACLLASLAAPITFLRP